ncbi:MAG: hypothetical protein RLZ52_608 [Pseudomonadota bacterium]|jgi:hypothetical protein
MEFLKMCKQCGNCNKEHSYSIDDMIDKVEESNL